MNYDPKSFGTSDWMKGLVVTKKNDLFFVIVFQADYSAVIPTFKAKQFDAQLGDIIHMKIRRNVNPRPSFTAIHDVVDFIRIRGPHPTAIRNGFVYMKETAKPVALQASPKNFLILQGEQVGDIYDPDCVIPMKHMNSKLCVEIKTAPKKDRTKSKFIVTRLLDVFEFDENYVSSSSDAFEVQRPFNVSSNVRQMNESRFSKPTTNTAGTNLKSTNIPELTNKLEKLQTTDGSKSEGMANTTSGSCGSEVCRQLVGSVSSKSNASDSGTLKSEDRLVEDDIEEDPVKYRKLELLSCVTGLLLSDDFRQKMKAFDPILFDTMNDTVKSQYN